MSIKSHFVLSSLFTGDTSRGKKTIKWNNKLWASVCTSLYVLVPLLSHWLSGGVQWWWQCKFQFLSLCFWVGLLFIPRAAGPHPSSRRCPQGCDAGIQEFFPHCWLGAAALAAKGLRGAGRVPGREHRWAWGLRELGSPRGSAGLTRSVPCTHTQRSLTGEGSSGCWNCRDPAHPPARVKLHKASPKREFKTLSNWQPLFK